jgi:hypothetical protein
VDVSFGTIWEAIARDQPDSVAISEPDRDYTFAEFDDRAARLAAAARSAPRPARCRHPGSAPGPAQEYRPTRATLPTDRGGSS